MVHPHPFVPAADTGSPVVLPERARAIHGKLTSRLTEVAAFLGSGGTAYGVDVALFNILLIGVSFPATSAKAISGAAAITVAYFGHRYITWRKHPPANVPRAATLFVGFSALGAGIQLACLWLAHQAGWHGHVADNLAGNVLGVGVATIFRYWTFRRFVFAVGRRPVQLPLGELDIAAHLPATNGPWVSASHLMKKRSAQCAVELVSGPGNGPHKWVRTRGRP